MGFSIIRTSSVRGLGFTMLIMAASAPAETDDQVVALPMVYQEHRFFVAPVLEDGRRVLLFTDTGGGLFFDSRAAARLGLDSLSAEQLEALGVAIAGHEIARVGFTRREDKNFEWMSGFLDSPVDGALGGTALRFFRVTVDYPAAVAVFEYTGPGPGDAPAAAPAQRSERDE